MLKLHTGSSSIEARYRCYYIIVRSHYFTVTPLLSEFLEEEVFVAAFVKQLRRRQKFLRIVALIGEIIAVEILFVIAVDDEFIAEHLLERGGHGLDVVKIYAGGERLKILNFLEDVIEETNVIEYKPFEIITIGINA